jgi:class 3 adenylate cyclase
VAAILIVDDESSARSTLRLLLRTRGHEVREADGVTRALTALATAPVDLVVTDLRLPDGQGLEVLQAAKTRWPDTQVILLTAYAGWESAKHAMQLGAFDYVEKAQEPEKLFGRIDAALREQAVRRAAGPGVPRLTARAGPEGERCVLTVLFADLQRSTDLLLSRDVHEAGGAVNQVLGDGIMALFGATAPRHDHALRAGRAALAMHAAVRHAAPALTRVVGADLRIRVGIASGEVIVRALGGDVRRDWTAVGRPSHVAARLEQLARPGTTLVAADTARLVDGRLPLHPLGRLPLKGIPDGADAYELLPPLDISPR